MKPRGKLEGGHTRPAVDPAVEVTAPWSVVVDGQTPCAVFGRYASRAGALVIVRQLRQQGLVARVEGPRVPT